ncbi:MAG: MarR family transcriptional regulator [Catenulispora sp. 13_1_20CM_3_70_7]|jgi:DNA-binding MarR family transcriptional regulator|nr:MarR family transcriptional regulator [Catenulisporales bacterium]OLE29181.1 MAG: MarR family transcriptional regulator [Catenulispora sp. 13_1_20CM_3_70_7]
MVREPEAPMGVVSALVRSAFLVDRTYENAARDHQLTSQQGQLLCVLMGRPEEGFGMGELLHVLGLAKSSLTGLVDRSLRRGLVRREADSADGRAVRVFLTEEGEKVAEEFYNETVARIADLTTGLSPAEQARLTGLLARLVLENQVPVVFGEEKAGDPADSAKSSAESSAE